ncbi:MULTISPECIES: WG repeat-containing protein [unclassified Sphingobacterium]|uniref:WG repeat-containing protein n=1 Tax=unclassified Sphingobacterium TaxID=2609468 RepID=UPI0029544C4E|nr:WG repeat-containing protein [Sphingobacterium sp. UGAL515B_05]WON93493.1 WG repeat-containing protein [Sphingobacterium sp. UGAL515B_05]
MKKISLSFAAILAASTMSFAQINKAFKINYAITYAVDPSEEAQAAPVSVYEAYVNNDKIKVISASGDGEESIFLIKKNEEQSIILYPGLAKYVVKENALSPHTIKFVPNQTKMIAGYPCKLAQVEIPISEDNDENSTLSIWYSDKLPATYWEGFDLFKKIPGAVLQLTTPLGMDMITQNIADSQLDDKDFIVPEDYEQVASIYDAEEDSEENNQIAENLYLFEDAATNLLGVQDSEEKTIVPAQYLYIAPFVGDLSIVQYKNEKYGAINLAGKPIIPFQYDYLGYDDHLGQLVFGLNEKYGVMDKSGKILISPNYDMISFINGGYAVFQQKNKYGILNQAGKIIVPATYSYISENNSTHFISIENDRYNLTEIKTNKIVAPDYDLISVTEEPNLFLASKDGKYGYLDGQGKVAIPFIYSGATSFSDGVASVSLADSDDVILINTKGERVEIDAAAEATDTI